MTSLVCDISATDTEATLAKVLADIVGVEQVGVDSHFFDDLGADSMLMARFCARVRKQAHLPSVSMKDVYRHPTIRGLAQALDTTLPVAVPSPTQAEEQTELRHAATVQAPAERAAPVGTFQYMLCATLQAFSVFVYAFFLEVAFVRGYQWIVATPGLMDAYVRAVLFGGALFVGMCALPVLAKWTLIGRWKPQRIRLWSLAYFRFWLVKTLIRTNPLVVFVGSPLYVFYLRALGAKIGRQVLILSPHVPVCTDLLTIGDGSVIQKDVHFSGYRACVGWIETGSVHIGNDAFVGVASVLDIETSLGNGAQLGHSSSLHAGQAMAQGERLQGSPARQGTTVDYRAVPPKPVGMLRVFAYTGVRLLGMLLVTAPLLVGAVALLVTLIPELGSLSGPDAAALPAWLIVVEALALSFAFVFGAMFLNLLVVMTVPRVLNLAIKPDQTYALYGLSYWSQRAIERLTNNAFFHRLFGDSSYIVTYLRWLGYDLARAQQTGSNFGTDLKHDSPFLITVGPGTMIADGLSSVSADYSSTSFRLSRLVIGARSFIGNHVVYPSQGKTGDNCLYGTKVMVPMDGPVREGVGLLGSPVFEIPRTVERDHKFDYMAQGDEFRRRLAAKDKHNLATIGIVLLGNWILAFELALLAWFSAGLFPVAPMFVIALYLVFSLVVTAAHVVLFDRLSTQFRPLQPQHCSIYEPYFWWHERHWKLSAYTSLRLFDGTPFKVLLWRLLGVRMGKRVFDDGASIAERTLVSIGDDCVLNAGSSIQPHSQEDGNFKSDRISIGSGCTIGVGALVHYGTSLGDGVSLAPASFLMKGEEVPANAHWGGNPATEIRSEHTTVAVRSAGGMR